MIALLLLACTSGTITTTELPNGRVGDLYSAAIEAEKRGRWVYAAEGLPDGLTINPSTGIVSGVPTRRNEDDVVIRIETPNGDVEAEQTMALSIRGPRDACGRVIEGEFDEVGLGDAFGVDLEATGGWTIVRIPVPGPEVEEMRFSSLNSLLYLLHPGVTLDPEEPIFSQASFVEFVRDESTLGWDTAPNLGAYQATENELQLLVAGLDAGPWFLETTCVAAPVVADAGAGPYRVGDRMFGGFSATKYDEEVLVEAIDPLPPGLELSDRGVLTGSPTEAGLTALRIRMTRESTGATSATVVGIGVYEPIEPQCGETVTIRTGDYDFGNDERGVPGDIDPDVFEVFEVPWDDHVGLRFDLDLETDEFDHEVLVLEPYQFGFSPYAGEPDVTVEASPQTWPPASYYQNAPVWRVAISGTEPVIGEVTLTCEDGPVPGEVVLPMLEPGVAGTWALDAVGGEPPISWSSTVPPPGVTLAPDGTLTYDGTPFTTERFVVTLEDAEGTSSSTTLRMWTTNGACDHVLSCGDTIDPIVVAGSPEIACITPSDVAASNWVGYVVEHSGTGQPGLLAPGRFDPAEPEAQYNGYQGELLAERGWSTPLFDLGQYGETTWPLRMQTPLLGERFTVCAVCGDGPRPLDTPTCE